MIYQNKIDKQLSPVEITEDSEDFRARQKINSSSYSNSNFAVSLLRSFAAGTF